MRKNECEGQRLRRALFALAASPKDFLSSAEAVAFERGMVTALVPPVGAAARRLGLGRQWCEPAEIVHTTIVGLCAQGGRVARLAAVAEGDPWNYLAHCVVAWMRATWGSRAQPIEEANMSSALFFTDERLEQAHCTMHEAVRLTVDCVADWVAPHLVPSLSALLHWLGRNPPQRRSHEKGELEDAAARFACFTAQQISASAVLVWGSRASPSDTSIVGGFLRDTAFRPFASMTHARALLRFKQVMRDTWATRIAA